MKKKHVSVFSLLAAYLVFVFLFAGCAMKVPTEVSDEPYDAGEEPSGYVSDLVCNLNTGILNTLQVDARSSHSDIINSIGKKPAKFERGGEWTEENAFFYYFNEGFEVITEKTSRGEIIVQIDIYTMKYRHSYLTNDYFNEFPGRFIPSLSSYENVASIKQKFGTPDESHEPTSLHSTTHLIYNKPYGSIRFRFNENGRLEAIQLNNRKAK